jgi:hypothetical protein
MVALWLYKCGVVTLHSMERYQYCIAIHPKDVKTNKIIKSLLGSSRCVSHNILRSHLGCEMPVVFHTTYSGRTLEVGEKCQVCFTQHTQVTDKGVNHIMKSKARQIWIMSVIYYYLHTSSSINIFCIHWYSIH